MLTLAHLPLLETRICPAAPPAVQALQQLFVSYMLFGVIAGVVICFLAGLAFWVIGSAIHNHGMSQGGVIAMLVTAFVSILYFGGMGMITLIFKTGCVNVPSYPEGTIPAIVQAQEPHIIDGGRPAGGSSLAPVMPPSGQPTIAADPAPSTTDPALAPTEQPVPPSDLTLRAALPSVH